MEFHRNVCKLATIKANMDNIIKKKGREEKEKGYPHSYFFY